LKDDYAQPVAERGKIGIYWKSSGTRQASRFGTNGQNQQGKITESPGEQNNEYAL
jgi:hypothetical protein